MGLWYTETFAGAMRFGLRVTRTLYRRQSAHQLVEVVETAALGRALIIDGIFMTTEGDEHFYHEMLVHPALVTAPSIARVLIIGGGDGGAAKRVLEYPEVEHVALVEIDACVVEAARAFLPALGAWEDPRLHVVIGDGIGYAKQASAEPFDVIFVDSTDPVGPGKGLFTAEFYRAVQRRLRPGGVFALQSGAPTFMRDVFVDIVTTLRRIFARACPYFGPVPAYAAGLWSWTYASDSADPMKVDATRAARVEPRCLYYNADIHRAAFAIPSDLRRHLGGPG